MTDDQFWLLIDKSRAKSTECEEQAEALTKILSKLEPDEIVGFEKAWIRRSHESYRWDLWAVAYIVNGGASDDGFEYFRSWLIGQGREFYEAVLASPNRIMERVPAGEEVECEDIAYAAMTAYEQRTGNEIPPHGIPYPREPVGQKWSEEALETLYPELVAHYRAEE